MIISPEQMRGYASVRPPDFRERDHLFVGRTRLQRKGNARGFLQGEIARRPGIGVTEAEQQIDIGGPRPDPVQGDECLMRDIRLALGDRVEIEFALFERMRDRLDRFDLGRGKSEPAELVGARAAQRLGMERIEGALQPAPDRARTLGRQLLAADDAGEAWKSALSAAQIRLPGLIEHRRKARVRDQEQGRRGGQIGLGVEEVGHSLRLQAPP